MKDRDFTLYGTTNNKGGLLFGNGRQLTEFLKQWPDQLFVMDLTVVEDDTSKVLVAYYKRYIVPEFRRAFKKAGERMTLEDVDIRLRELSSVLQEIDKTENGFPFDYSISIESCGNHRASEYIEDLILIAAENFDLVIDEPKSAQ